jgi:hypothetical protein
MLSPISSSDPRRVLPLSTPTTSTAPVAQTSSPSVVDSFEPAVDAAEPGALADPLAQLGGGLLEQLVSAIFGALMSAVKSLFSGLMSKLGGKDSTPGPVDGSTGKDRSGKKRGGKKADANDGREKADRKDKPKKADRKDKPKKADGKDKPKKAGGKDKVGVSADQRKLAAAGLAAAKSMGGYSSQGLCATGVSRAISSSLGIWVSGNGNQIDNNLPRDKFKEVHMSLQEALKIPGLVLTWEHTSSALGSKYGHTAITTGDGHTSASDFIERDTLGSSSARTGLRIFVPR